MGKAHSNPLPHTCWQEPTSWHSLLTWGTETGEPWCHRALAQATPAPSLLPALHQCHQQPPCPERQGDFGGGNDTARALGHWQRWDPVVITTARSSWVPAPLPPPATVGVSVGAGGTAARAGPSRMPPDPWGSPTPSCLGRSVPRLPSACPWCNGDTGVTYSSRDALCTSNAWQRYHREGIQGGRSSQLYRHRQVLDPAKCGATPVRPGSQELLWPFQPRRWVGARPWLALRPGTTLPPRRRPQCTCASRLTSMAQHAGLSPGTARAAGTDSRSGRPRPPPFLFGKLHSF